MKLSSILSLGAIFAVFAVGVGYLTFGVVKVDWFNHYAHITMTLPDSAGLVPRSAVLYQGVKVGEITAVSPAVSGARVALRIHDNYRVPAASTVRIEQLSTLGEPYVEFTPTGTVGPALRDGQQLDTDKITAPPSIPQMARAVTDLLQQIDPKTVAALVDTFDQGLSGTEKVIPDLSRSTGLLAATLLSRTPQLRQLLTNVQTLGADIDWLGPSLAAGGPYWGQFGERVHQIVDAVERIIRIQPLENYTEGNGLLPFLQQLDDKLNCIGPDVAALTPVLQPLVTSATDTANRIDLGSLITQALHGSGSGNGNALQLQINVK